MGLMFSRGAAWDVRRLGDHGSGPLGGGRGLRLACGVCGRGRGAEW